MSVGKLSKLRLLAAVLLVSLALSVLPVSALAVNDDPAAGEPAPDNTGGIAGVVTGEVGSGETTALAGVAVHVYPVDPTGYLDETVELPVPVVTDANGVYIVEGLAPGSYTVFFEPTQGLYQNQYYNGKALGQNADPVEVEEGTTTPDINATLVPGAAISGTVLGEAEKIVDDDVPLEGVWVLADPIGQNGLYDETREGWSAMTDANGQYTIRGLAAGTYSVKFYQPEDSNYLSQVYRNKSFYEAPTPVTLTVGATKQGIDVTLDLGGSISGKVTDETTGTPMALANVFISAEPVNSDGSFDESRMGSIAVTGEDGVYQIKGLESGAYIVSFYPDPGTNYIPEYYNGSLNGQNVTPVYAMRAKDAGGVDATLKMGGAISGNVRGQVADSISTIPLQNVVVNAIPIAETETPYPQGLGGFAVTDANGDYTINGLVPGTYRVWFGVWSDSAEGYQNEYYEGTRYLSNAKPIIVEVGGVQPGIDAVLLLKTDIKAPEIAFATGPIDESNQASVEITGTAELEDGYRLEVYVFDQNHNSVAADVEMGEGGAFTARADVSPLADGTITVSSIAIDDAMNESAVSNQVEVFKEAKTPDVAINAVPVAPNGENGWYKTLPAIKLEADEAATIYYRWGSSGDFLVHSDTQAPVAEEGINTLQVYAVDLAGKTGDVVERKFKVDLTSLRGEGAIAGTDPGKGAIGVARGKTIEVTFSDEIQEGSRFNNIELKLGDTSIAIDRRIAGKTVIIDPKSDLAANSSYTVFIPSYSVKDKVGNVFSNRAADGYLGYKFNFTTASSGGSPSNPTPPGSGTSPGTSPGNQNPGSGNQQTAPGNTAVRSEKVFPDVPVNAWFRSAVSKLTSRSIIGGYANGEFRPHAHITRAEFAKMLCAAMGWELSSPKSASFKDVNSANWAYKYVETAKAHGAIGGYADLSFRPNSYITREEIAKIMAQVLNLPSGTSSLTDINASWAKDSINACAKSGIVSGYADKTFRPKAKITRAEAAKIIAGVIKD